MTSMVHLHFDGTEPDKELVGCRVATVDHIKLLRLGEEGEVAADRH